MHVYSAKPIKHSVSSCHEIWHKSLELEHLSCMDQFAHQYSLFAWCTPRTLDAWVTDGGTSV